MTLTAGETSIQISEVLGNRVAHDLMGSGSVKDLLKIFRLIQQEAEKGEIHITLDHDNPRFAELMKVYQRFGARPTVTWLKVGKHGIH